MPVSVPDARSFKALIPYTIVKLPVAGEDGAEVLSPWKISKLGIMPIVEIVYAAETVAPVVETLFEAVLSGTVASNVEFGALIKKTVGEDNLPAFVAKAIQEAPETVYALLVAGMKQHLVFTDNEGETFADFLAYIRSLSIDVLTDLVFAFINLNFPGGAGPFVASFQRIKSALPQGVRPPPKSSRGSESGTQSTPPSPPSPAPVGLGVLPSTSAPPISSMSST